MLQQVITGMIPVATPEEIMNTAPRLRPDPATASKAAVLSKAVVSAAQRLELSQASIAQAIGASPATVSRLFSGKYLLDPARSKEWELAALLVRLYRSLLSIVATEENARAWLRGANRALGAPPIELIARAEGLVRVLHYLDAARGRI